VPSLESSSPELSSPESSLFLECQLDRFVAAVDLDAVFSGLVSVRICGNAVGAVLDLPLDLTISAGRFLVADGVIEAYVGPVDRVTILVYYGYCQRVWSVVAIAPISVVTTVAVITVSIAVTTVAIAVTGIAVTGIAGIAVTGIAITAVTGIAVTTVAGITITSVTLVSLSPPSPVSPPPVSSVSVPLPPLASSPFDESISSSAGWLESSNRSVTDPMALLTDAPLAASTSPARRKTMPLMVSKTWTLR